MRLETAARPRRTELETLPDRALVDLVLAGDEAAFETVMRRHNRLLFRSARGILGSDADAEEAVQEAYVSAYRNLDRFAGDSRLSTWLVRIVANEALGRLRGAEARAERARAEPEALDDPDVIVLPFGQPRGVLDPEAGAARAEIRALVEAAIDELPPPFRAVFVLRAVEELSVEDTAACLGIPPETVKSRYLRARRRMRQSLDSRLHAALRDSFPFAGARCDRIVAAVRARLAAGPPDTG